MRLRLSLGLSASLLTWDAGASTGIRGGKPGIAASSRLSAFRISPDGDRAKLDAADGSNLKEILCSAQVLSHLKRCSEGPREEPHKSAFKEPVYPMGSAYRKAVEEGLACPLPAPFLHVGMVDQRCCIPTEDPNIWPNFCKDIDSLGKSIGHGPVKWVVSGEVNVVQGGTASMTVPPGVYRVGVPDVPSLHTKYSTSLYLLATYFVLGAGCFALLMAVFSKLEEEEQIIKGKQREEVFSSSQHQKFIDDDEEDADSPVSCSAASSLSPAREEERDAIREDPSALMGQVSLSFGLLPALPRGRSTNPSSLNSPRLTARG
jgi:hypothetical protein